MNNRTQSIGKYIIALLFVLTALFGTGLALVRAFLCLQLIGKVTSNKRRNRNTGSVSNNSGTINRSLEVVDATSNGIRSVKSRLEGIDNKNPILNHIDAVVSLRSFLLILLICLGSDYAFSKSPNSPPVANSDSYSGVAARSQSSPGLLANDSDPDGDTLYLREIVSGPSNGALQINNLGGFTYQPNAGYIGNDSFIYRACDRTTGGLCATATVNLNQPNSLPTATNKTFYNLEARGQYPANILTGDSDPDGDAVTYKRVVTPPQHGSIMVGVFGVGRFVYTPTQSGYLGNDSFTYEICDLYQACSTATVTLIEANRPPVAVPDFFGPNCNGGTGVCVGFGSGGVLGNDFDLDGDSIFFDARVTDVNPARGTLYNFGAYGPGTFIYSSANGTAGMNSFTYRAKDSYGATAIGAVFLFTYPNDDHTNAGYSCPVVAEPVNVTNGNMWLQHRDYGLPGVGENIEIDRFYNSVVQHSGLFGFGWSTKYDESLWFYDDTMIRLNMPDGRAVYFGRTNTSDPFLPISPGFYGNIVKNPGSPSTYTLTFKDGRVHKFYTDGRLDWQKDRNGNQTILTYSGLGNLTNITDASGKTLTITWNVDGQIDQLSDSMSTIATYEYYPSTSLLKTVTYHDGSKYEFIYDTITAPGKTLLKTVKDADGNILETHDYDSSGRATTSEKQGGVEKYIFDYSSWSASTPYTKVTYKKNAGDSNIETKYYFDKSRERSIVSKIEGGCGSCGGGGSEVTEFFYDGKLNLTKQLNALGHETTYTYDAYGNVLTKTDKVNSTDLGTEKLTYNQFGQILTYQDKIDSASTNNTLNNVYDANGNLKTTTDALGKTTTINYPATNNKGLPESVKDARNNITKLKWNSVGLLEEVEDAYSKKTNYVYDGRGRIKTVTNALNHATTYNYFDDAQRKVEIVYPNADKITYKYNVRRLLESITDERGKITTYTFDGAYRLTKITDALGHFREFDYDLMSNLKFRKDGLGNQTDYKYDDFNRLKEVEYPAATTGATRLKESFEYDQLGRIKKATDMSNRVTNYVYDDANRTRTVTNAELEATTTKYNARGQMIQVTDAKNQIYEFTYEYGRMKSQKRAGGTMSFDYDDVGNLEKRTDYIGRTTEYEYDNLNRLKKISYLPPESPGSIPAPAQMPMNTATYNYDDISRLTSATNEAGTVSFEYDNRNRMKKTTDVFGHILQYDYTLSSTVNRKTLKFDGANYAEYNYDDADRLMGITDAADSTTISFGYDDADRLTTRTFVNGVTTTYKYDGMSRLTGLKDAKAGTVLFDRQYGYNTASQIEQITEPSQTRSFGYDNVNRLLSMTNGTADESYTFDDVGNRTASHKSATYNYQTGQFNRVSSTATANYAYDANGNLTSKAEGKELWRFGWDFENRLTSVSTRKQTVRYRYDALGRRVQRYIVGGKENTKFIHDGQDVLVDDNNGVLTKYINGDGIDNKLKMRTGNDVKYFIADHLGSTNALADSSGNITSSASYDSFGNTTDNINTRYRFTGREYDDFTGLHYYRARWYDGNLGRFISEDPIGLAGGDVNLYGYVWNSPNSFTDPSGLQGNSWGNNTADWLDKRIETAEQYWRYNDQEWVANGINQTIADSAYKVADLFRIGNGVAQAYYCEDNIYGKLAFILMDIGRAAGIAEIILGGTAGRVGNKPALSGVPCARCFEAETLVQTDEGLKPIEKIEAGDRVLSYNEKTRLLEYQEVLAKFTRAADDIYSVRVAGETEPLGVTSEHPFFVRTYKARDSLISGDDEGEWRETRNLQIGDEIKLANGNWAKVLAVSFKGAGQVYNFTVAGNHNYFVGNSRLLTHNKCEDILMPNGQPIGTSGTSPNIRQIQGNLNDAQTMFDQLKQGGTVVNSRTYPGTLYAVPEGGTVGLRTKMTNSPNSVANIDVNIPGIPIKKIKYNP